MRSTEHLFYKLWKRNACDNCGRSVNYQRFHEHKKTKYCMSHKKTEIEKYREQVERLTKLLEEKDTD